jgi:hypothetical protein
MINNIFRGNPGTKGKKFLGGDSVSRLYETNNRQNHRFLFFATQVECENSSRNLLGNSDKDPRLSSIVRTHRGICLGTARRTLDFPLQSELIEESVGEQREGSWTFLCSHNSSRNLLGNSEKDPGLSSIVRTHRGICWGTARRILDVPLHSELIEESVREQREGPWTFLYSQNSSRNLLGNSMKDPGLSSIVKTHRGICWGSARRTLDFPLELVEESVGEHREGPWNFLYKYV